MLATLPGEQSMGNKKPLQMSGFVVIGPNQNTLR